MYTNPISDIADMFPSAHVIGIDISVMPRDVPVNASFEMVDINSPGYQELPSHYDMVHVRELRGSMRAGEVLVGKWYQSVLPLLNFVYFLITYY